MNREGTIIAQVDTLEDGTPVLIQAGYYDSGSYNKAQDSVESQTREYWRQKNEHTMG